MRGLVTNLNQYTLRYGRDFPNDFRRTLNQRVRTLNQHFRDAATDRKLLTNVNMQQCKMVLKRPVTSNRRGNAKHGVD
ncbi:unnamed protein product [Fasciola hepatica]|uniref:Uncharacterized protein n=1 Tax=Fasciola hepatica TaxID=6192 RepID=A0ABC9HIL9_FASHE